ncbi:patatin-like phospholipase family protein [Pseudoxanthomonas daejeonensis]|uniref:patatin-like phospholipase family protein n=1 Tax=Pseudoxanthomonas daejeonensis TaxID=266062 RepID=UPI001F541BF5|nr:patatin-like phospholipase family protein [Pseudoxanthomonas daejeonensis]UNK59065.1 patatin-like phospholipase family protein [Pseudoxanthomonas daejeonensis]
MVSPMSSRSLLPALAGFLVAATVAACGGTRPEAPPEVAVAPPPARVDPIVPPVKIGLALGGGAAKGFAHIGVIKMLEANGFKPEVVAGTSAGSVVGALYASGLDPFQLQEKAVALDEASIRDVRLFSGGLVQGLKLQDYVNQSVDNKPIERMRKPFAAVATRLETGERTVFIRGNTGQAVRASSSVPGVFEPVTIGNYQYVDGGVVSPVPVDAARQLGADFVIAVDISSKASGKRPDGMLGIVNQSIAIMGQRLGEQELARADVVIRPDVLDYGSADFTRRNQAILQGEKAALAALPQIRAAVQKLQAQRLADARAAAARREAALAPAPSPQLACKDEGSRWNPLRRKDPACTASN